MKRGRPKNPIMEGLYCPKCGAEAVSKRNDYAVSGARRYSCFECKARTTAPSKTPLQVFPKFYASSVKKHKFFVITSALNNTDLVPSALDTFKRIADMNNGALLIIPTYYENPDAFKKGDVREKHWPEEIIPYLCTGNVTLSHSIEIRGSHPRIVHTAVNPLSGMQPIGGKKSQIYGHAQVTMQMIATPKRELPKMMHTTGTISKPNYSKSKDGEKARFHHSVSALIVEIEGKRFWTREVHFNGEGAYDLDYYYTPGKRVKYKGGVPGMVYGDVHVRALPPKIRDLIHGQMDKIFKPQRRIFHDVHDQHIGSHHTAGDIIFYLRKAHEGTLSVKEELMRSVEYLDLFDNAYIVDSNHHRHLDQWYNKFKANNDRLNNPFHIELGGLILEDIENDGDGNAYRVFLQKYCKQDITFVDANDPFIIEDIDCSQHGDRGPNGARGSPRGFANSCYKMIVGHGHTPYIEKGTYGVGVMSMELEYAKGLGSWCNTHAPIYPDGKRALIHIVDGKLSPSMRR